MSENVKRYKFMPYEEPDNSFEESPDGEWVMMADYSELQDSAARAENDARDREAVLSEQLNDYIDRCKATEDSERQALRAYNAKCTALAAAEERADRAEKRSQFNKDNHLAAEQEIERLTAELSTLRRTSVRVDVLERWCTMWINDHTPYRLVTGLRDACRSRRPTDMKGE